MPPPLPSYHRGMTANPLKPGRYRPGKAVAEEPSSSEEEEEDDEETKAREEKERRRQEQQRLQRQRQQAGAPKASSFPGGKITKGVKDVSIEDEDEEGFVTDEDDDEEGDDQQQAQAQAQSAKMAPRVAGDTGAAAAKAPVSTVGGEDEEEDDEEAEESSEEESSSEEEAPRRVLLRPTFIKKDKRNNTANQAQDGQGTTSLSNTVDSTAETEARRVQRQEKADMLIRDQLEKDAIARSAANRAWDDDEVEVAEEEAIDDTDGVDPEAEYAAWKLRELKRLKREREEIEVAEKEREEVERRRNLTAEERDREDREFIAKQNEDKEANRGQTGFMQRYFHKGSFFRDDMEREGLDRRNVMGNRFVDDVSRETLPEYMQIRDMTKLGKKGRTRYKDLKSEDTGRFGEGFNNRRHRDGLQGITDERFLPDRGDDRPQGPTGANAGPVRQRRRSRSRSRSPRRDRRDDRGDRYESNRDRSRDEYRPDAGGRRKRSHSPYDDGEKRRRTATNDS